MDQDSLAQLGPILDALRSVAEGPDAYAGNVEEAGDRFSQALAAAIAVERTRSEASRANHHSKPSAVFRALLPPRTSEEAWRRLKPTLKLTDRQLEIAVRVGVLVTGRDGQIRLRRVALLPTNAIAYLFVSGVLFGFALLSVLFDGVAGPSLVIRGVGLGLAIGSTAGFVLNHSFRLYPIMAKLESVEPWLSPDINRTGAS